MDEKDKKIMAVLQENSRLSARKISKKTLLPITTVHNRIKKLNKNGVIRKYTIVPDYKKIGMGVVAYVLMIVDYKKLGTNEQAKREIERMLLPYGTLENFSIVTGVTDAILRIRTTDMDTLNDFLVNRLRQLEFSTKTETLVVLKDV